MGDFENSQPTQEQLHKVRYSLKILASDWWIKMRYYIQSSSTRSSESSQSEFDENKNNTQGQSTK